MAKRRPQKAAPQVDALKSLRKTLAKRSKRALIDTLVEFAAADHRILRQLDASFTLEVPPRQLVAATRQAIADATWFDKRDMNRNFDYDHAVYAVVKRNLGRLVKLGQLPAAMDLSLELMVLGSHQIEMSDEGLMTDEVEGCLQVVLTAVAKCDLPADEVAAWCAQMIADDRMGFVCDTELQSLRRRFEASP
jgi:hypothetical protein